MIFLEQTVNQILMEEGQIIKLSDLGITWEDVQKLFVGTFEQAKNYITIYEWTDATIGNTPTYLEGSHIKHITYNTSYNIQRIMPDLPQSYWEYNPWTKEASALMNTNFALELAKTATVSNLTYSLNVGDVTKDSSMSIVLPCIPQSLTTNDSDITVSTKEVTLGTTGCTDSCPCKDSTANTIQFSGNINGTIDMSSLIGTITFDKDYSNLTLNFKSKYLGIEELDLSCELFYNWFKANLLTMMGSIKKQVDMSGSGLPFDFSQDGLLERGRELMQKVEELKATKSHWSNF